MIDGGGIGLLTWWAQLPHSGAGEVRVARMSASACVRMGPSLGPPDNAQRKRPQRSKYSRSGPLLIKHGIRAAAYHYAARDPVAGSLQTLAWVFLRGCTVRGCQSALR